MAKRLVLATHASLAQGLSDALALLVGGDKPYVICAYTDCATPLEALTSLFDSFEPGDAVIVCTDILGGSVNTMVGELARTREIHVVTGVNLGAVIELALMPEGQVCEESIRSVVDRAREGLLYANDLFASLEAVASDDVDFFDE